MKIRQLRKNEPHDNGPCKPYEHDGDMHHSHITGGRMFEATVIRPHPHLAFGYARGVIVYVRTQRNRFYKDGELTSDETVYKVCRSDGRGPRSLTAEQAKHSLKAKRDGKGNVRWTDDRTYTRVHEHYQHELHR